MPKRKTSGAEGDICFSGHINEQSACKAGKSAKARECECTKAPKEKQAAPKATFVFLGILMSNQPAKQAKARKRGSANVQKPQK
ncbi:MAG: hypothetical protein ACI4DU_11020 [Lachnospiraceae bacterium]